jgi:hypothetical protein
MYIEVISIVHDGGPNVPLRPQCPQEVSRAQRQMRVPGRDSPREIRRSAGLMAAGSAGTHSQGPAEIAYLGRRTVLYGSPLFICFERVGIWNLANPRSHATGRTSHGCALAQIGAAAAAVCEWHYISNITWYCIVLYCTPPNSERLEPTCHVSSSHGPPGGRQPEGSGHTPARFRIFWIPGFNSVL